MPFAYMDDHWDENQKMIAIYEEDPRAIVLYWAGITWCRRSSTPGVIPPTMVQRLMGHSHKAKKVLIAGGLWEDLGAKYGIQIHDWDQWNKDYDDRSASARNAAQVRWIREKERKANEAKGGGL